MALVRNTNDLNDGIIKTGEFEDQLLTSDVTGTAGTITDTTTYAVTDQDGLTSIVTVNDGSGEAWDGVAQTVTFVGATTTALQVAAKMNDGLLGCSVVVTGGQVVITNDLTGITSTISVAAGTGDLTWATPTDGTGQAGVHLDNTLLALDTSTLKLVPYVKGGSTNGNGVVYGVLTNGFTAESSGDTPVRVMLGGSLLRIKTVIDADADASNIDATVKALCLDKGLFLAESKNLHTADNA